MCTERLLLLALLALGCTSRPTGTISGRVTIDTEAQHAGVVVSAVSGAVQVGTVTDDEGRFEVRGLPEGLASLTFGAADTVEGTRRLTAPVGSEGLEVIFHPAGRLHGTVVSAATMAPLREALVVSARGTATAITDREGAFRLTGVPSGPGTVVVSAPGFAPLQVTVTARRGESFDVGVVSLGPASTGSGPAAIEGRVVFPDGAAAPGATVRLRGPAGTRETTADARGAFRFEALAPGAVEVVASLPGFETTLPQVLALEGTSGLLIADGLYPLSEYPIPLMLGRKVALASGRLTPDEGALIALTEWPDQSFLLAPLDGGATTELVSTTELSLTMVARIVAVTSDSRTIALSVGEDPSEPLQLFLVSTGTQGRQLLSERACLVGVHDEVLYFTEGGGGSCPARGPLKRVALRFGSTATTVGHVQHWPFLDLPRQRLLDRVFTGTGQRFDVDLVEWATTPRRSRLLSDVRTLDSLSPDGAQLLYERGSEVRLVDLDTGHDRVVLSGIADLVEAAWTAAGGLVLSSQTGAVASVSAVSPGGPTRRLGDGQAATLSPDGAWVALSFMTDGSGLKTLSVTPFEPGPTQRLGGNVGRHRWTSTGALLFVSEVDRGTRLGRVMRWRPGGVPEAVSTEADVDSDSLVVSDDGLHAAFVRRRAPGRDQVVLAQLMSGALRESRDTVIGTDWFGWFSPDGRWLAHSGERRFQLTLRSTRSASVIPLFMNTSVTWLRDGSVLLQTTRLDAPWKALEGAYLAKPE